MLAGGPRILCALPYGTIRLGDRSVRPRGLPSRNREGIGSATHIEHSLAGHIDADSHVSRVADSDPHLEDSSNTSDSEDLGHVHTQNRRESAAMLSAEIASRSIAMSGSSLENQTPIRQSPIKLLRLPLVNFGFGRGRRGSEPGSQGLHGRAQKKPDARSGLFSYARRSACYFRSSSCPVHEPRIRRILARSTAPWFDAANVPSTCFAIASALAVAPSKAAQFL